MLPFKDTKLLEELLTYAASVGFEMGVAHLVKHLDSIQHAQFDEHSLPVYFSEFGSQRMLWACLPNANYDPHMADPKGVILASVQCQDPVKQVYINKYVELYDSRMQI